MSPPRDEATVALKTNPGLCEIKSRVVRNRASAATHEHLADAIGIARFNRRRARGGSFCATVGRDRAADHRRLVGARFSPEGHWSDGAPGRLIREAPHLCSGL